MAKVIRAEATYSGGGVYIYTGQLDNGNYFMTWTDYEDEVEELNADPNADWDNSGYEEWQNDHMVAEHSGAEGLAITKEALDWIIANEPEEGNYSVGDIEAVRAELEN